MQLPCELVQGCTIRSCSYTAHCTYVLHMLRHLYLLGNNVVGAGTLSVDGGLTVAMQRHVAMPQCRTNTSQQCPNAPTPQHYSGTAVRSRGDVLVQMRQEAEALWRNIVKEWKPIDAQVQRGESAKVPRGKKRWQHGAPQRKYLVRLRGKNATAQNCAGVASNR